MNSSSQEKHLGILVLEEQKMRQQQRLVMACAGFHSVAASRLCEAITLLYEALVRTCQSEEYVHLCNSNKEGK